MRIAYLGQMADISTENGISKKIRAQVTHWRGAGHEVTFFSLAAKTSVWPGLQGVDVELIARGGPVRRVLRSLQLVRRIQQWRPHAIYFRYGYHSAGLPGLFRQVPTVAEINSDDLAEYPLTLSPLKVAYHRATRARMLRAVRGFVAVTRELQRRFDAFSKPGAVIGNGIHLADFAVAPLPGDALRLVFMGNAGSPWHGLHRLAEIAVALPHARVDVIGWNEEEYRSFAGHSAAPPTVYFHGSLPREKYQPLLHAATAGIGPLALFKNKMEEASPLKVREYLANGLPVLGAYRDTDIPADADYFFRLPNDGSPIAPHREKLAEWLQRWRTQRVPRAAIAHLDYSAKETERLAFMRQVATRGPTQS